MSTRRIIVITCVALLEGMTLGLKPRALAQNMPDPQTGATANQGEDKTRLVLRLAEDLVQFSANDQISLGELGRRIEQLRAALTAYGQASSDGSATGLAGQAGRPIVPKTLEPPSPGSRRELNPRDREESLRGTHLAPSPEEMRARAQTELSITKRGRIAQMIALLSDLERTASAEPSVRQERVHELAVQLNALAATLPP